MYGSIYQDEMNNYKKVIEEQFSHIAENAKKQGLKIVRWAFDYVAQDRQGRAVPKNTIYEKMALDFAKECAEKFMPNVESV